MKPWRALIAANVLTFTACVASTDANPVEEKPAMSMPPSATSRPPAPEVKPVEHNGVRYIQDATDERQGDQKGGYLAAVDAKTGEKLWRVKVYTIAPSPVSNPGRHFRSMRLVDGNALEIVNESGGVYRVDLATKAVTQTGGPPESAPAKPAKPKPTPE